MRIQLATLFFVMSIAATISSAATVSFSGTARPPYAGFVALGTFKPGFNPSSIYAIYHDPGGNLLGFYGPMVADGYFRPLASGPSSGPNFSGVADTTSVAGQPVWLVLFDQDPDSSLFSVICSGTGAAWLAPAAAESSSLDCNSADVFVLGSGGSGSPLSLQILPFPDPSSGAVLLLAGMAALLPGRPRRAPPV